jgi:hypothetical protein
VADDDEAPTELEHVAPEPPSRRRLWLAVAAAVAVLGIAAGVFLATRDSGGDGAEGGATGAEGATTTNGDGESGTTGGSGVTTTTESDADDDGLPDFPADQPDLVEGGQTWALYLAVARDFNIQAPEIRRAQQDARDSGYNVTDAGDLSCDQGAVEALGLDPQGNWVGVALYFPDEESAQAAREAFEARDVAVAGIASVTVTCLA